MPDTQEKTPNTHIWALAIGATALVCCSIAIYMYSSHFSAPPTYDHERWGQFGDFFGGTLNPILSALSLFAILGTLLIQSRELSHSTKTLADQSKHLELQAFENTFFSLIKLHNENALNIDLEETEEKSAYSGRGAFKILTERLRKTYNRIKKYGPENSTENETISSAYIEFFNNNQRFYINYINNIQQTLDFIKNRAPDNNKTYQKILISQLSLQELLLLFYHFVSDPHAEKLQELIEIDFFSNLGSDYLFDEPIHSKIIKRK